MCKATLAGCDDDGPCTAIGHARTLSAAGAALRQRHRDPRRGFRRHLRGRAGACRRGDRAGRARGLRAPPARRRGGARAASRSASRPCAGSAWSRPSWCTRRASIRPRCSAPWRRPPASPRRSGSIAAASSMRSASPAAWPAASSNISPRARGPSACMPAGRRNRACARRCWRKHGFIGPRTVFEGTHGLFHGFAHTTEGDYDALDRRLRHALGHRNARLQALSLRDHDASLYRLRAAARGARRQGRTTSRKWSARSARAPCIGCGSRSPTSSARPTAMARSSRRPTASPPASCAAMSGSSDFTDAAVKDPAVLALAAKVRYVDRSRQSLSEELHRPHPRRAAPTAAWSRSASPTCAAAPTSR